MASRGWAEIDTNFPTMQQRVADELGRRIVAGGWQPGAPLPVEDALASEIGVSLDYGYWVALVAAIGIAVVGFTRSIESGGRRTRKAPGTV